MCNDTNLFNKFRLMPRH